MNYKFSFNEEKNIAEKVGLITVEQKIAIENALRDIKQDLAGFVTARDCELIFGSRMLAEMMNDYCSISELCEDLNELLMRTGEDWKIADDPAHQEIVDEIWKRMPKHPDDIADDICDVTGKRLW